MKKIFLFSIIIVLVWVNIATAKTYNSTDVPKTIYPGWYVTSTINISDTFSIPFDVNVTIDITHYWDGSLYIYIQGPDGTNVKLSDYNGGSGDNYTNTTFDDEASISIKDGSPPFTGSFRPEEPLSAFDSKTTNGTWTLYVWDMYDFPGTLNSWSLTISSSKTYNSTDVPKTIYPGWYVTSTINISDTFSISDVNVTIDITHYWDGSLYIYIQGPDGTNVKLSDYNGGSGDNYTNTTFDDEASISIKDGSPPFTGSFRPEGSLSAFDGKTTNGTWTLYVWDMYDFPGTLNSWSLTVTFLAPRALSLDGDGDYVECGEDGSLSITDEMTVEAWVKVSSSFPADLRVGNIIGNYPHSPNFNFEGHKDGRLRLWWNNGERDVYATDFDMRDDTWHHVVVTRNKNIDKIIFYTDGNSNGEYSAGSNADCQWPLRIGDDFRPGIPFHGLIDEVRIWNVARTQEEIKATMDTTLRGDEEGLVGYWNFDDGTANDLSPFGNDGTLMGDAQIILLDEPWPPTNITVSKATDFGGGSTSPGTENVRFLQLGVQTDSGTANITGVKAKFTSTSSAVNSDISAFDVYEDTDGDGNIDGGSNPLGTVSSPDLSNGATVTGLSFGVTTTTRYLLLVLDIAGGANPSHTAGLELTNNTFITSSDGVVASTNFPIKNTSDTSLPVELSAFSATTSDDNVILKWRTETEVNNIGFAIYRSEERDGNYDKISFVSGAGNTAMPRDYQFVDENVEPGKTYYYFLEDVDIAGERNRNKIIKVVVSAKPAQPIPKVFRLLQNYPNPFNPDTWIPFDLAADATVTICIYDVKGQLVRQLDIGEQKAGSYLDKDKATYWNGKDQLGQSVSSGLYFYTLKAGGFDGFDTLRTQPKDFVATRRMVILK